jgi:hypothetical protein
MNRWLTVVAATCAISAPSQVFAGDPSQQTTMSKRQLVTQIVSCMKKRMAADKNSSYNEALKACNNEVKQENDTSSSAALVASDTQAKP